MKFKSDHEKAFKNAEKVLKTQSTYQAKRIGEELVQAVASFDDVYIVPVYTSSKVTLSLSGNDLDKKLEEDTLLSQLLLEQEEAVTEKLSIATGNILKEAFKG